MVRTDGDRFQIIAGERRWRAAHEAGFARVPVVVRDVAAGQERSLLEMALIENIQRENLNPIDEALAYRRLGDEFQLTQEDIAAAVGKDRATVANCLRLLKLPDGSAGGGGVRRRCRWGTPARCWRSRPRPTSGGSRATSSHGACRSAKPNRWSEGTVERGRRRRDAVTRSERSTSTPGPPKSDCGFVLGTRVRIVRQGARGRIEIDFGSEDELIRIYRASLTER